MGCRGHGLSGQLETPLCSVSFTCLPISHLHCFYNALFWDVADVDDILSLP